MVSTTTNEYPNLLLGMAMRLAVDFGLHVSTKAYVEAGSMSAEEARGRSVAFWGSYATDQYVKTKVQGNRNLAETSVKHVGSLPRETFAQHLSGCHGGNTNGIFSRPIPRPGTTLAVWWPEFWDGDAQPPGTLCRAVGPASQDYVTSRGFPVSLTAQCFFFLSS